MAWRIGVKYAAAAVVMWAMTSDFVSAQPSDQDCGWPAPLVSAERSTVGSAPTEGIAPTTKYKASDEIVMTLGFTYAPYKLDRPAKAVKIGDTRIVDISQPEEKSDNNLPTKCAFNLEAKSVGETNILFLDARHDVIKNLKVTVTDGGGSVKIHNKALLNSYTVFKCTSTGCRYVDELEVNEPTTLPRGHYQSDWTDKTNPSRNSPPALLIQPVTPGAPGS